MCMLQDCEHDFIVSINVDFNRGEGRSGSVLSKQVSNNFIET